MGDFIGCPTKDDDKVLEGGIFDNKNVFTAQKELVEQFNNNYDMHIQLDLFFEQKGGKSYVLCFEGPPKFDDDHQEEKKFELDLLTVLQEFNCNNESKE